MITWNASLETGNAVIDREHQAPFGQINALDAALQQVAAQAQLGVMIGCLSEYIRGLSLAKKTPAGESNAGLPS
jgi:hemerythrin